MALHQCETHSQGAQTVFALSLPKSAYLDFADLSEAHLTVRASRVAIVQPHAFGALHGFAPMRGPQPSFAAPKPKAYHP